jgi:hypothetical protein
MRQDGDTLAIVGAPVPQSSIHLAGLFLHGQDPCPLIILRGTSPPIFRCSRDSQKWPKLVPVAAFERLVYLYPHSTTLSMEVGAQLAEPNTDVGATAFYYRMSWHKMGFPGHLS